MASNDARFSEALIEVQRSSESQTLQSERENRYASTGEATINPLNMYSTNGRLMVTAPMPGLEPENITIQITDDGRLILQGALRGLLKEHDGKQRFFDEWHAGAYTREVSLPLPVNAVCANVSYGNGVLTLAFPLSDRMVPARLTLERTAPSRGQHQGNAGHPPTCVHVHSTESQG